MKIVNDSRGRQATSVPANMTWIAPSCPTSRHDISTKYLVDFHVYFYLIYSLPPLDIMEARTKAPPNLSTSLLINDV